MEIRIEKVLRDVNDKQIGANIYIDGVRKPRVSLAEIRNLLAGGAVATNFVLTSKGLRGKGENLESTHLLTLRELGAKYPDRWVIIQDGRYIGGGTLGTLIDGVVVVAYTSEEYLNTDCRLKYEKSGV